MTGKKKLGKFQICSIYLLHLSSQTKLLIFRFSWVARVVSVELVTLICYFRVFCGVGTKLRVINLEECIGCTVRWQWWSVSICVTTTKSGKFFVSFRDQSIERQRVVLRHHVVLTTVVTKIYKTSIPISTPLSQSPVGANMELNMLNSIRFNSCICKLAITGDNGFSEFVTPRRKNRRTHVPLIQIHFRSF